MAFGCQVEGIMKHDLSVVPWGLGSIRVWCGTCGLFLDAQFEYSLSDLKALRRGHVDGVKVALRSMKDERDT